MSLTIDRKARMSWYLEGPITLVCSFLLALLYSGLIALISSHIWAALIALPIQTILLWYAFLKWNLLRYSGFLAVLPASLLAFEVVRSHIHPSVYAYEYKVLDRSHYKPGVRVPWDNSISSIPEGWGWGYKELLIGKDGFRADPKTGQGNPERCALALFGDSMIFGSGLPYSESLGPVLAALGTDACVFGVSGNTPLDYLTSLKYVAKRIEKGGHVVIYLYAYNDFVSLSKYFRRRFRALSSSFVRLAKYVQYVDAWRRTTYTYGLIHRKSHQVGDSLPLWELKIGKTRTLKFYYSTDPAIYKLPSPLSMQQRVTLEFFFEGLRDIIHDQPWHVSIVIIPDNLEMMANFANNSPVFQDLDQRRIGALKICRTFRYQCEYLGPYLYEHALSEGENPYFIDDRHFSSFGTSLVAKHILGVINGTITGSRADHERHLYNLEGSLVLEAQKASLTLNNLRFARNSADYDMEKSINPNEGDFVFKRAKSTKDN